MKKYIFSLWIGLWISSALIGQSTRINTFENIGWYNTFLTVKASNTISFLAEYQCRRDQFISHWQQSLLRLGVNVQVKPGLNLRAGYGWIETFPYGDIPINGYGKDFTEHRIYEALQFIHPEFGIDITHRLMLEQRFVGTYNNELSTAEDDFPLLHRVRYLLKFQIPLIKKNQQQQLYLNIFDELFIGFGEQVKANIFDQNRIACLLGYALNSHFSLEAGFLNQTIQFGRQINGKNVFQYNNGFAINAIVQLDARKRNK